MNRSFFRGGSLFCVLLLACCSCASHDKEHEYARRAGKPVAIFRWEHDGKQVTARVGAFEKTSEHGAARGYRHERRPSKQMHEPSVQPTHATTTPTTTPVDDCAIKVVGGWAYIFGPGACAKTERVLIIPSHTHVIVESDPDTGVDRAYLLWIANHNQPSETDEYLSVYDLNDLSREIRLTRSENTRAGEVYIEIPHDNFENYAIHRVDVTGAANRREFVNSIAP